MIGGVVATAAVRTFPFRVFSFPKEIVTRHSLSQFLSGTLPARYGCGDEYMCGIDHAFDIGRYGLFLAVKQGIWTLPDSNLIFSPIFIRPENA